jgi:hypothetical protein
MSQINLGFSEPSEIARPPGNYAALFSVDANQLGIKAPNGNITYLKGYPNFFYAQPVVLTAEMIESKQITLLDTPKRDGAILLIPAGGPPQTFGLDFTLNDNILTWDGMGLDGILEENDRLTIFY